MAHKVYIFIADGFEDIEGLTVVDLMRRAGIDITTVSIKDTKEITTSHGIIMQTDSLYEDNDYQDADLLVLPGGMPGTRYLAAHEPLCRLVTDFCGKGGKIAAICAAPAVVFGGLGLLKDRKATCYPGMEDQLCCREFSEDPVVVDGNITTSRGLGTALDFALCLIGQLEGEEKAAQIAESVVHLR